MADYKFYFKKYVKTAYVGEGSRDEALAFLKQYKFGVVKDFLGNVYESEKELKNAKSIGSSDRAEPDREYLGVGKISKDSDRKLSGSSKRNAE